MKALERDEAPIMVPALVMLARLCCIGAAPYTVVSSPEVPVPAAPAVASLVVGVGDSITFGTGTSNPPATSFLTRAAEMAHARSVNLGIPAALTSQIATEVPSIPLDASVVVVYAGTNDVSAAADNRVPVGTAISQTKYFEPSFDALIASIRARVPAARLIIVTVRDFGRVERSLNLPENRFLNAARTAATHEWDAHQRSVAAVNCATVLDLESDAQWYVSDEYGPGGDVHPNDAGALHLARALAALLAL